MKLQCIIIDDEPLAIKKLKQYIDKVQYLSCIKTFTSAVDALNFLKNNIVDLIFLDIQMEELTGIQFLEALIDKPKIIICSAYEEYALKGFEHNVSDYLLKPYSFQRFVKAVSITYDELKNVTNQPVIVEKIEKTNNLKNDFIFIKTEYRIQKVEFKDILFIEGMKDYLQIVTIKEKLMTLLNFKTLLENLPSDNFIRVHKSFVVSVCKIDSVHRKNISIGDHRIPIGETYREYFFNFLRERDLII